MADTYKTLAQVNPSAATLTDAYTVPAATQAVIAGVHVANRSVATSFRVSVAVAGAADDNKQYIAYDVSIGDNETIVVGKGITLQPTDKIRVRATLATLSFNIFGDEIT